MALSSTTGRKWTYPLVRRDESVIEDYGGVQVVDPYRWLEDPDSEETEKFVKAQNEISEPYLANCPARDKFHARWVRCTYRTCTVYARTVSLTRSQAEYLGTIQITSEVLYYFSRMTELYNYPKYSAPFKRGSRYFYFMNTGLQNQRYVCMQSLLM